MNRHIGFFTAYQPHVELAQEGIGRLMVYILRGMMSNGDRVTILCPTWHRSEVKKLLKEFSLEKVVKIKSVRWHPPVMLMIYDFMFWLNSRSQKEENEPVVVKSFDESRPFRAFIFSLLASYSFPLFFIFSLFFLVWAAIIFPIWILWSLLSFLFKRTESFLESRDIGFLNISQKMNQYLSFVPRSLRSDTIALGVMTAARRIELKQMIKYVNKCNIDLWYVPNIFWKETLKIKKKRVLVVPDIVYAEYPHLYSVDPVVGTVCSNLDWILAQKPKLVCYSNHVKNRQLIQLRDIKPRNITVIPHGVVDISEHLRMGLPAKEIIEIYIRRHSRSIPDISYVRDMNFAEGRFIIYSSQARFHKNVVGLLRVLDKLLRREHISLKLVLTCSNLSYLKPFLEELNLTREVIFLPRVTESVLAALNHLAALHVNPTLFEGGFPFTFSEAYSVGTPSIMSSIDVTREYVDEDLAKVMLFDPYDEEDFIAKVKWGLEHRDELLALEKPLYEKFAKRTWDIVAKEYVDAMSVSYRRKLPKRKRKKWKRS